MLDSHGLFSRFLCVLCFFAANSAGLFAEEKQTIKITSHKLNQSAKSDSRLKITSSITFTGTAPLKPATIVESHLTVDLTTLKGKQTMEIDKRLSAVRENKTFGEIFTVNKVLPPADYTIATIPSERQRDKTITFTDEERQRLPGRYDFTVGTPLEQIIFIREESAALDKHIQTARNVYADIETFVAKSQEKNKLPDNNAEFSRWLKPEIEKVAVIMARLDAARLPDAQDNYLTYYPYTITKLKEVCNSLLGNLQAIEATVQLGAKQRVESGQYDPVSSVLAVDKNIPALIDGAGKYLTKESIFNLALFLHQVTNSLPALSGAKHDKEWETRQSIFQKTLTEYERLVKEYQPPDTNLWKEFTPQLEQLYNITMKLYDLCCTETKTTAEELNALKTQDKDLFGAIHDKLK